jgi:endoglucanase
MSKVSSASVNRVENREMGLISKLAWVALPALAAGSALPPMAGQGGDPVVISSMDKPFLFQYGSWEKGAKVEAGKAVLKGTPRGGAGQNLNLDLFAVGDRCPALRVKVGPGNKAMGLRLMLLDDKLHAATWSFTLPTSGEAIVTPADGASLAVPSGYEKDDTGKDRGPLNLRTIRQWQITGDWSSDNPMDVEVTGIFHVAPTAKDLAARKAKLDAEAADRAAQAEVRRSLRERYGKVTDRSPKLERTYFLGPDLLALEITSGRVALGTVARYVAQAGDEQRVDGATVFLKRAGKEIGWLLGTKRDQLATMERFEGDPLLDEFANDPAQFSVFSSEDPAYVQPLKVTAVYRKSKPVNAAIPAYEMALRHRLYLQLPKPLQTGKRYRISMGQLNVAGAEFVYNPDKTWSEAVRVSQIGFRPDDPVKRAFLSIWLGTGGAHSFGASPVFRVVDNNTGVTTFSGKATISKLAKDPEKLWSYRDKNLNQTDVYRMDFPGVVKPGTYRVVVDGVGCSDPFPINADVWQKAFRLQLHGLYNQRSGMELGPPFTEFRKPRDMHPADGTRVTQSAYSVLDGGGENPLLEKLDTGKPVPEAWGGYHDAGDWNPRRVTHLKVTYAQLEIAKLFPAFAKAQNLNIPKPTKLPDILNEALWEIDLFRRLQKPDGGVPFGIESNGDPSPGEVSWLQTKPLFVYAPDPWSSWVYVSSAVRFAQLARPFDPKLANTFQASALKAMLWAEQNAPKVKAKLKWEAWDARNLAAVNLYEATGDQRWHDVFLENTCLKLDPAPLFRYGTAIQSDAAFAYALLPAKLGDAVLKARARAAFEVEAQKCLIYAQNNAWNLTTADQGKPLFLGFYSTPGGTDLVRAHFLTAKPEYLAGIVQSCLFSAGANPSNMTYTSGLGARSAIPFKMDARATGQPIPKGLTVYGNCDYMGWPDNNFFRWPLQWHISRAAVPDVYTWPLNEAMFETYLYPATEEYTVDVWAPNVYVWGYLAARK